MNFFQNLKTQNKILLSFTTVILVFSLLAGYILMEYHTANETYKTEITYTLESLALIEAINDGYTAMLTSSHTLFMNLGNDTYIDERLGNLSFYFDWVTQHLNELDTLVRSHAFYEHKLPHIQFLSNGIDQFYGLNQALLNDAKNTTSLADFEVHLSQFLNNPIYLQNLNSIEFLQRYTVESLLLLSAHLSTSVTVNIWITVAALVLLLILSLLFAFVIAKPINRSLNRLREFADRIARGEFSHTNESDAYHHKTDEFSTLLQAFSQTTQIISQMVDAISTLNVKFSIEGDIDYRMDDSGYTHSYKEMIRGINHLVASTSEELQLVMSSMESIANGHFDITIADLPGKKVNLSNSMTQVLADLTLVNETILHLSHATTQGDLTVREDAALFKGSWAEIIHSLNNLVAAVDHPLSKIEQALIEMQNGQLSNIKIDDKYQGTFETVRHAINETGQKTSRYISEIDQVLYAIASGDLTTSISTLFVGDYAPIKKSLNRISESLNKTISDIERSANQVLSAAELISLASQVLSEGADKQQLAISDASSSISEIDTLVVTSAGRATDAKNKAGETVASSQESTRQVNNMVSVMDKIKESSEGITGIMKAIESISFQTNLLSLNAAVEAARAGEAGRGFSVVAEEVRILAGRSQASTKETQHFIESDKIAIATGLEAVKSVEQVFGSITQDVDDISDMVDDISDMSTKQVQSIRQITTSMKAISEVTLSNATKSKETANTADVLHTQAEMLKDKIAYFKLRS